MARMKDVDLIFVGYFGQPLVPLIKKLSRKPIIFDAFLSAFDTLCFDRKWFNPNSVFGKFSYWLDKHSCELADRVLLDTNSHIDYFMETFGLGRGKFERVFTGADDAVFHPLNTKKADNKFRVFCYTTYHPLHGVEHIVRAADRLRSYEDIEFEILGRGMEYKKIRKLVDELNAKNIRFADYIPPRDFYDKVTQKIAQADICLGGHFANLGKAKRTIAEKTFEFIAMKKPVIIGDNAASKELFTNRKDALMVEMANAEALAEAILELRNDAQLREKIAEEGYKVFRNQCTPKLIGSQIKEIMTELVGR